jgi:glycosyltransferase involved in cell wall biosynthesis
VRGGRAVITLHSGLLPEYLAASAVGRKLARNALRLYSAVIAVSRAQREALLGLGVPAAQVLVQPAFLASQVEAGAAPSGFDAIRARRFPLVAMAHHPSKLYGRALMFEALSQLRERYPDVGVALFGPGCDSPELEAEARQFGVAGLLECLGSLEHAQALGVLARADAFVRPTTADGDAISVREALTLGVPCVASDAAARPSGTYVFPSGNARALVESICDAVTRGPGKAERVDAGPLMLELYRSLVQRALQPARVAGVA